MVKTLSNHPTALETRYHLQWNLIQQWHHQIMPPKMALPFHLMREEETMARQVNYFSYLFAFNMNPFLSCPPYFPYSLSQNKRKKEETLFRYLPFFKGEKGKGSPSKCSSGTIPRHQCHR